VVSITAICGEISRRRDLEPSHGFGLIVDGDLAIDSCSREAAEEFFKHWSKTPKLGISAVENPHHSGGFEILDIPLISWRNGILKLKYKKLNITIFGFNNESIVLINRILISPCGINIIPLGKLSNLGIKAEWFIGNLGGSTASPYSVSQILGELKALGVKYVVPLHNPPEIVRVVERKFRVVKIGVGDELEIP